MAHGPYVSNIFQENLGPALCPTQPLLPEPVQGFRHQYPAQSARLIEDGPVIALLFPTDVYVLAHHVQAPVADTNQRAMPECGNDPGHGKYLAEDCTSDVSGKRVSVRGDLGVRRSDEQKKKQKKK